MIQEIYDENYFTSNNYVDYLNRAERYHKLAEELVELYTSINLIHKTDTILDYGCAVGFLLDGLAILGFDKTYGYDISSWALSHLNTQHTLIGKDSNHVFDWGFFLDVLEHMEDLEIRQVFNRLRFSLITIRIPCSIDGQTFYLHQSRKDETHINCKTSEDWTKLLNQCGYDQLFTLNLKQIYNSAGVFCACFRRKI